MYFSAAATSGGGSEALKVSEEECSANKCRVGRTQAFVSRTRVTEHRTSRQLIVAADGNPAKAFVQNRVDLDPPVSTNPLRHWTGALRGGEPGIGGQ